MIHVIEFKTCFHNTDGYNPEIPDISDSYGFKLREHPCFYLGSAYSVPFDSEEQLSCITRNPRKLLGYLAEHFPKWHLCIALNGEYMLNLKDRIPCPPLPPIEEEE